MTLVLNGHDLSGTTSQRPTNADVGQPYFDTTLNQWIVYNGTAWQQSSGGSMMIRLPILSGRNAAGGSIVTSGAGSTDFTAVVTYGTSELLSGTNSQNNTKTNDVVFELTLPPSYVAGANISLIVNSNYAVSSGTTITATVDAEVRKMTDSGGYGSDLNGTNAIAITSSAGDKTFTIDGTTLSPGDRLAIKITTSVAEGGNTGTATGKVNSVRLAA